MRKGFDVSVGDSDQEQDAACDSRDNITSIGEEVFAHPCAVGAVEKQPDFIGKQAHSNSNENAGDEDPSLVIIVVQDSQNAAQGKG